MIYLFIYLILLMPFVPLEYALVDNDAVPVVIVEIPLIISGQPSMFGDQKCPKIKNIF